MLVGQHDRCFGSSIAWVTQQGPTSAVERQTEHVAVAVGAETRATTTDVVVAGDGGVPQWEVAAPFAAAAEHGHYRFGVAVVDECQRRRWAQVGDGPTGVALSTTKASPVHQTTMNPTQIHCQGVQRRHGRDESLLPLVVHSSSTMPTTTTHPSGRIGGCWQQHGPLPVAEMGNAGSDEKPAGEQEWVDVPLPLGGGGSKHHRVLGHS